MIDLARLAFRVILQAAKDAARGDQEARAFFFSRAEVHEEARRVWLSVLAGEEMDGTALDEGVIERILAIDEDAHGTGGEER